ncbi:hypothetical protein [Mariprofundus sp. KV]|uniref:hypothetical protein n=1 Tax=Mariprofundus sp. KV TaxID=2608715 RepID=UPI0015A19480|nr:hypothetical protein [Mariprofundus sp. KV]NWF35138.1 hypothetical protein [Mariprofundus sp. KV]
MRAEIQPNIYLPYTIISLLANLSIFGMLLLIAPVIIQLHVDFEQMLPGLAQLFFDYKEILGLLIVTLIFMQVVAIFRKAPSLFHLSMAGSILTVLILVLTMFSSTLLPALRLLSVIDG